MFIASENLCVDVSFTCGKLEPEIMLTLASSPSTGLETMHRPRITPDRLAPRRLEKLFGPNVVNILTSLRVREKHIKRTHRPRGVSVRHETVAPQSATKLK